MHEGKGKTTRRTRAARYERAFRALCENSIAEYAAGVTWETPEYHRVNDEEWEAAQAVPRWRRWLIDRRVLRELDYFNRVGGTG